MARTITFQGSPLTLAGRPVAAGMAAPAFTVTSQDMKDVRLADFKGKIKLVSSFPSLDTPVCDLQVKEFNKRAATLSADVAVIGISKDLPFAQKRFCGENAIKNEVVLSDYKRSAFGIQYGLLIRELNLLARSVMIIDKDDTVRYVQLVGELTSPPAYDDALKALEAVIKAPAGKADATTSLKCKPCEGGVLPLPKDAVEKALAGHRGWQSVEDKKLVKEFGFKTFADAKYLLDTIAVIAEEEGHHPTLTLIYNKLKVTLTTHAAGGLTDNDFIMAKIIDAGAGS